MYISGADSDTFGVCHAFGRLQLFVNGVPATSSIPGNETKPRSSTGDRGAKCRAGKVAAQRTSGTRGGEDATRPRGFAGYPVQKDLHVQTRKRLHSLRRHRWLHCDLLNLQRQRIGEDPKRVVRQI